MRSGSHPAVQQSPDERRKTTAVPSTSCQWSSSTVSRLQEVNSFVQKHTTKLTETVTRTVCYREEPAVTGRLLVEHTFCFSRATTSCQGKKTCTGKMLMTAASTSWLMRWLGRHSVTSNAICIWAIMLLSRKRTSCTKYASMQICWIPSLQNLGCSHTIWASMSKWYHILEDTLAKCSWRESHSDLASSCGVCAHQMDIFFSFFHMQVEMKTLMVTYSVIRNYFLYSSHVAH